MVYQSCVLPCKNISIKIVLEIGMHDNIDHTYKTAKCSLITQPRALSWGYEKRGWHRFIDIWLEELNY